MAIARVKAQWTIPGAGAAYSVFHFGDGSDGVVDGVDATAAVTAVRAFFNTFLIYIPQPVKIQVLGEVESIDSQTGELMGVTSGGSPAQLTGGSGGTDRWAAPAGACVTWSTGGIRELSGKPRRVRGRTFIVPISQMATGLDGTLDDAARGKFLEAANNLRSPLAGYNLGVYCRPGSDNVAQPGIFHSVTGARVTDQVAILRSRRN